MGKYQNFCAFLSRSQRDEIAISFEQIERVIGSKLPASAYRHRPWWSNNPSNNALTQVWLDAGFRTEDVDMSARRLVFRRKRTAAPGGQAEGIAGWAGKLKGLVRLQPGYDFTQPADPNLAAYVDEKLGSAEGPGGQP